LRARPSNRFDLALAIARLSRSGCLRVGCDPSHGLWLKSISIGASWRVGSLVPDARLDRIRHDSGSLDELAQNDINGFGLGAVHHGRRAFGCGRTPLCLVERRGRCLDVDCLDRVFNGVVFARSHGVALRVVADPPGHGEPARTVSQIQGPALRNDSGPTGNPSREAPPRAASVIPRGGGRGHGRA
jgi:hypothetical protein